MLVDVILIEPYNGVSAGYETSLPAEVAEALIKDGKAKTKEAAKPAPAKVESKKQVSNHAIYKCKSKGVHGSYDLSKFGS